MSNPTPAPGPMETEDEAGGSTEPQARAPKRSNDTKYVDPDTGAEIPNPKRPKIDLDVQKKVKCLGTLASAFMAIFNKYFPQKNVNSQEFRNINIANQITSILITAHNYHRQAHTTPGSNLRTKAAQSDYKIHTKGNDISHPREEINKIWLAACNTNGLEYKAFATNDVNNWYGTMGPYLNFFSANSLRKKELRVGHGNIPIKKDDQGNITAIPISKYGLTGAHHVLLEGISYPPERRSSMLQSLGPLTSLIMMIRTDGVYRRKWEMSVKRACSHVPGIDDIINLTKSHRDTPEIAPIISLIGDILLITTARQATRMTFPLNMFVYTLSTHADPEDKTRALEFFNTSGTGGFYFYKVASNADWFMEGHFTAEEAQQVAFHCIFGSYKEDLGVLSQITDVKVWYTREQMGLHFQGATNSGKIVRFRLPELRYYSKLSSANQTGLLAANYPQVSSIPCFSGHRKIQDSADFFTHLRRRHSIGSSSKSIPQCVTLLGNTLNTLIDALERSNAPRDAGTTSWFSMQTLALGVKGTEVAMNVTTTNKFFMGRAD